MQAKEEGTTMESVKVDVQKLQLLNERLVQTLEALNQVRLSVQGIQHTQQWPQTPYAQPWPQTPGSPQWAQTPGTPWAYPAPYAFQPGFQPGFPIGYSPFIPGYGPTFGTPFTQGIQHTTATPWPQTPWTQWTQPQWPQTPWTQQWTQPQWQQNGISHSTHMMPTTPTQWTWSW